MKVRCYLNCSFFLLIQGSTGRFEVLTTVLINIQFLCDMTLCQLVHRTVLAKPIAPCFRVCVVKEELLLQKWVYFTGYSKCDSQPRGGHVTKINHSRKILCKENLDAYNRSQKMHYCSTLFCNTTPHVSDRRTVHNMYSCISK